MWVWIPQRRTNEPRWRKRRREQDSWLFAVTFVLILLAGLAGSAAIDGVAGSEPLNVALVAAALLLACAAPPAVVRLVWHEFANRFGLRPSRRLLSPHVIDGDTIHDLANGLRYRLANIDAPETGDNAKCHKERERGERAKMVARGLVADAQCVEARPTFRIDQYGRRIAFVLIDGVDLGEMLVERGLARPWRGTRRRWCGPRGGLAKIARNDILGHSCQTCRNWRS